MATMILARHGRTTANATGVLAGRSKGVHLDDHGLEQARAVGVRLSGLPLAALVSSPLERCRETAREINAAQPARLRVSAERGLLECDYGSWTNRELKTLAKEKLWGTVQAHPSAAVFPDGEGMAEMSARAVAAVRRWDARVEAEHGPDAVWVAVSHGDVIKAILADALGAHLDEFQRIVVDPASLSVVRYTPHRPFVMATNTTSGDLAHLRPPKRKARRRALSSDAAVGGGAGADPAPRAEPATSGTP
ncbi:histidine phosphatase family protein [Nocardioides mesophilus]|uniref:MSMEG_4193 family putative phosphomutase n=1 Tax=Nocardioides mesophilus TaxID=433659 RepID=A0A7G9RAZ2_9ACTN|nr:histidine phosphatase family protein [Nocardioides mesophilus]QNN52767.1 MSMEG_4193 family putative phosphomutase [Nocardioides mesophilus]